MDILQDSSFNFTYFSLALCIWPCIMTYKLWSILRFKNIKHKSTMLYFRYSIITWGLPLLVTAICLTVDILTKRTVIRFGNHGHCWIVDFYARLLLYIVPFSVMSYGSFLVIFIAIIQTKHEKRKNHSIPAGIYLLKVNNRNTRTRCEICSKLTIKTPERC